MNSCAEQVVRTEAPLVRVRQVSKTFRGGVRALDPVDLDIERGEFLTLIGPSGCGKSTLLRLIAGLVTPSGGRVDVAAGASRRAFVFQTPTLMPWASVADNVRLPLDLEGTTAPEARERVAAALARVGLQEFSRAYPRELSGGMQMRVSIARALITDPALLLMDEPFAALDEITRARLDRDLLGLWTGTPLTVVFVTHSISEAVLLSNRVVVMSARPGRLLDAIRVDEPYPRERGFALSERHARLCAQLGGLLEAASGAGPDE